MAFLMDYMTNDSVRSHLLFSRPLPPEQQAADITESSEDFLVIGCGDLHLLSCRRCRGAGCGRRDSFAIAGAKVRAVILIYVYIYTYRSGVARAPDREDRASTGSALQSPAAGPPDQQVCHMFWVSVSLGVIS